MNNIELQAARKPELKKVHGNTGKKNAKKDKTQDEVLTFRLSKAQKAAYIKAAQGGKLKDWVLPALDKAAGLDMMQAIGWISIDENFPKKMDNYLVFMKGDENNRDYIAIAIYSEIHGGFIGREGVRLHLQVTHWMPLPKYPTEN